MAGERESESYIVYIHALCMPETIAKCPQFIILRNSSSNNKCAIKTQRKKWQTQKMKNNGKQKRDSTMCKTMLNTMYVYERLIEAIETAGDV